MQKYNIFYVKCFFFNVNEKKELNLHFKSENKF